MTEPMQWVSSLRPHASIPGVLVPCWELAYPNGLTVGEVERMERLYALGEALWEAGKLAGLTFVKGCQCCGGNTPELLGNCPCQHVDVRPDHIKAMEYA